MRPQSLSTPFMIPLRSHKSVANTACSRNLYEYSSSTYLSPLKHAPWYSTSRKLPLKRTHVSFPCLRYASSAAAASKPAEHYAAKHPRSSVPARVPALAPRPKINEKLNPPTETYAPPIEVPSRAPGQKYAAWLWKCGRAYIGFYKAGVKNIRGTVQLAKAIRNKAKSHPDKEGVWTRAEWQLVRRSRRDMLRLPAFACLVLIFGEWLPLLAIWITPVIPDVCRIPKQVQRELEKSQRRRTERERRLAIDAARLIHNDRKARLSHAGTGHSLHPRSVKLEDIPTLDLFSLLSLSARLDAHSKIWDLLFLNPPRTLLRWDVKKKLEYVKKDDSLIERDGGWQGLGTEEVQRACVERGITVLGKSEGGMRKSLAEWFGVERR